jgi:hypothetical protein
VEVDVAPVEMRLVRGRGPAAHAHGRRQGGASQKPSPISACPDGPREPRHRELSPSPRRGAAPGGNVAPATGPKQRIDP